jgi:tetratricopeptide (TPR) repeat protein
LPRRRIVVLAVAVAAGIAVLALLANRANRGGIPGRPLDAGVAVASGAQPPPDPARDIVTHAGELVAQGDKAAALDLLSRAHRQYPDSAAVSYAAGRLCFASYYWTDGLKNFRDALRSDPAYRTDPELIKIVLRGFITTPSYNEELARFLREDIGSAAQSFLEETARDHPNPAIRNRAASELRRYR